MTTPDAIVRQTRLLRGRNPHWESSPNAPGVLWRGSTDLTPIGAASLAQPPCSAQSVSMSAQYDEADRRLMDTFPASDAVGRY